MIKNIYIYITYTHDLSGLNNIFRVINSSNNLLILKQNILTLNNWTSITHLNKSFKHEKYLKFSKCMSKGHNNITLLDSIIGKSWFVQEFMSQCQTDLYRAVNLTQRLEIVDCWPKVRVLWTHIVRHYLCNLIWK